jgi:enterochelin esterase family protein
MLKPLRIALANQMENGYKLYWIGIGRSDFLCHNNLRFKAKLESMGMPYVFVESNGGHIWKNWRAHLSEIFPQIFQ